MDLEQHSKKVHTTVGIAVRKLKLANVGTVGACVVWRLCVDQER